MVLKFGLIFADDQLYRVSFLRNFSCTLTIASWSVPVCLAFSTDRQTAQLLTWFSLAHRHLLCHSKAQFLRYTSRAGSCHKTIRRKNYPEFSRSGFRGSTTTSVYSYANRYLIQFFMVNLQSRYLGDKRKKKQENSYRPSCWRLSSRHHVITLPTLKSHTKVSYLCFDAFLTVSQHHLFAA